MTADKVQAETAAMVRRVDALFRQLDDSGGWLACAACAQPWNRLRPCHWVDENQPRERHDLCVACAEQLGALPWIAAQYPAGLSVQTRGSRDARVVYGASFSYRLWVDRTRIRVRREQRPDEITDCDNALAAYFSIWGAIRAGDDPNPQNDTQWASAGKFGSHSPIPDRRRQRRFPSLGD